MSVVRKYRHLIFPMFGNFFRNGIPMAGPYQAHNAKLKIYYVVYA